MQEEERACYETTTRHSAAPVADENTTYEDRRDICPGTTGALVKIHPDSQGLGIEEVA